MSKNKDTMTPRAWARRKAMQIPLGNLLFKSCTGRMIPNPLDSLAPWVPQTSSKNWRRANGYIIPPMDLGGDTFIGATNPHRKARKELGISHRQEKRFRVAAHLAGRLGR